MSERRHRNIAIFIPHLGCPWRCVYCNQQRISSAAPPPTPAAVKQQIEQALSTVSPGDIVEIAFFGGNFTTIATELQLAYLQAAHPFVESGAVSGIRLSTRPDAINADILQRLKQHGVVCIELGVQSLDAEVLARSGRGHGPEAVGESAALIKAWGFQLGVQLMLGLPGDTAEKALATARAAIALQPDMARIYPTLVIEDTELARQYRAGRYQPLTLAAAVEQCHAVWQLFRAAGIPVIRMGLHSSAELNDGSVLAGPWHPAFGELVQQYDFLQRTRALLSDHCAEPEHATRLTLSVNPRDLSRLTGYRRENISRLEQEFALRLNVKGEASLPPGSIVITEPDSPAGRNSCR